MNKLKILFLIGACFLQCKGREPFKPTHGSITYLAFFPSRYRGMCVGSLVSRMAVMTAAVCVTSFKSSVKDTRPLNVIIGATYRHQRHGIRVQVTKILLPNLSKISSGNRAYLMSKSAAILLLKRRIPDVLLEIPIKPVPVDWSGKLDLRIQEECLMPGWHFFYRGDKIFVPMKYLLQRNLRVQFLNIVKKDMWCDTLSITFRKFLSQLGFQGYIDRSACICVRDGMYGAPLVCRGRAVGMLMAPDAQWPNCTGFSNMIHLLSSSYLQKFMKCISELFEEPKQEVPWATLKKQLYQDDQQNGYDYVRDIYDRIITDSDSDSSY